MRIKNLSASNHDFTHAVGEGKDKKMSVFTVKAGAELEFKKDHPLYDHLKGLPKAFPAEWVEIAPPKLSKEELEAQLKERREEEKAEAEAKKKAEADAKAAGKKEEDKKDA